MKVHSTKHEFIIVNFEFWNISINNENLHWIYNLHDIIIVVFWMEKIHNNIAQKFRFTFFASIFNIFSVFLSHTNYQQTTETILINNKTHFHCIVFWCVLQVVVIKFSMILALFAIWISHTIWLKIFILYFMCVFVVNLLYIDKQYHFHSYQK